MTSNRTNRLLLRVTTIGYALLLGAGSLLPGGRLSTIPNWSRLFSPDKVAHFGAYALFALLLSVRTPERGRTKNAVSAVMTAVAFGALMEVLQGLAATGRQADPVDMVANLMGALLGGRVGYQLCPYLEKRFRHRPGITE